MLLLEQQDVMMESLVDEVAGEYGSPVGQIDALMRYLTGHEDLTKIT